MPAFMPPSAAGATAWFARPIRNTWRKPAARLPRNTARELLPLRGFLFGYLLFDRSFVRHSFLYRDLCFLARPRTFAQRCALGRRQSRPRPISQFLGIVEQPRWQFPVGI